MTPAPADYIGGKDIFEIIDNAINIASLNYPEEFRRRRGSIVERIYLCPLLTSGSKEGFESKEEEGIRCEVLRIKEVLHNSHHYSESEGLESLMKLQDMVISVKILEETKIGVAINDFRKRHRSKEFRDITLSLIKRWKDMVLKWDDGTTSSKGGEITEHSAYPSVVEEEEMKVSTKPTSEDMSKIDATSLAYMDGNRNKLHEDTVLSNEFKEQWMGEKDSELKQTKPPIENSRPFRCPKIIIKSISNNSLNSEQKADPVRVHTAFQWSQETGTKCSKDSSIELTQYSSMKQAEPSMSMKQDDLTKCQGEDKLKAARRKLHEGYQKAENAKKQRVIQVMELHELPKKHSPDNRKKFRNSNPLQSVK
ncbi:hypothetical protein GIB67_034230 [Kingdonia uniflora]|uniref:TFIIS N-terminal domain-containing protein n=1 Tax=Kingdonia uniflora TaxID=39325 RepID=A0A7J7NSE0_9MAGN|nr:hypothetical protein GIB67_034230 [Kingdonia uniflora]